MLGKIPDFSQTLSKIPAATGVEDLAAVRFYPSQFLYAAQLAVYIAMLIFSFVALLPFFLTAWYWLVLWLAFLVAMIAASISARRTKSAPAKQLHIIQQRWRLHTSAGEFLVRPHGEALLWSWLIIIPVRELLTGKLHYLVALPDSLDKEDWRRLSVWLNLCFARG